MISLAPVNIASMNTEHPPAFCIDLPDIRLTVLVVDDHPANRKLLSAILEAALAGR